MNTQTQTKIKDITEEHFELIEPLNDMVDLLYHEYGEEEKDSTNPGTLCLNINDVYNVFINVIEEMGLNDENTIEDINRIYHEKGMITVI